MTSIFVDQRRPTLEDVGNRIQTDQSLTSGRRAAIKSAISTLCRIIGTSPAMVPADANFIRRKLKGVSPAKAGVKEHRFSTVKSQVLYALRHLGLVGRGTYLTPMVGDWTQLWRQLPDKYAKTAFSRFFRYGSAPGLGKGDVDDAVSRDFLEALTQESFIRDPRVVHQNFCRAWNRMIGVVPGWPDRPLTVPRYTQHYILPPETFPASFWTDVDAWLDQQSHGDILNLDGPPRPLAPRTLRQYRYMVRAFASALVHRGHDPAAITSLAYLVHPKNTEAGLRFLIERHGNKPHRSAADTAVMLRKIAKHWVKAPEPDVAIIARYAQNLMPKGDGLGIKNRRRLAPLRDERNLVRLFLLPSKIRKEIEKSSKLTREQALLMQLAVALIILTYAPLRIGNLALLRTEHHLRWSGPHMKGTLVIDIDGGEVKNRQTLQFPLPADAADLIGLYIRKYLPVFAAEQSGFLIPSDIAGRPKRSDTLGKQLSRLILRATGLQVNPHLYRHLVHIIVLNRFPGADAMISRILGHKSLQTAMANYATEDIGIAMRAFHGLIGDVMASGRLPTASIGDVAAGLSPRLGG